jgi:RNA-directed DNA polymerase
MSREAPVRIREGLGVQLPRATRLVITGISKELLRDQVQALVAHFLKERGLELSHEKTQITQVKDGFDFLGQNVRGYRCGKVLIKPSSRNVQTFLTQIREPIKNSGSQPAGEMIQRLNQQIKGWTMYHRYASSKRTFN